MARLRFLIAALGVLTCLGAPVSAQNEDRDRGLIEGFLEDNLSSAGRDVNIIGFRGALSSRATVERLTIADSEGIWLSIDNAVLDWDRSAVLGGRFEINALTADRIEVLRAPITEGAVPDAAAPGFALPELPVSISIGTLSIPRVELGESFLGEPVALSVDGTAQLAGGEGSAALDIQRIDGAEGRFALDAAFDNENEVLALDLSLSEGADGIAARLLQIPGAPPLSLSIEGNDPISDFTAEIALSTEGVRRLQGVVTRDATGEGDAETVIDISGDLRPLTEPSYHEFLGEEVALAARVAQRSDGSLELSDLSLETGATRIAGDVDIGPDGWPRIIDITGKIGSDGRLTLPVPGGQTELASADLILKYDAARDEGWRAGVTARNFSQPGFAAERLALNGTGRIERTGSSVEGLIGKFDLDAKNLQMDDPALQRAVGRNILGKITVDWSMTEPLALSDIDIAGEDYQLTGDIQLTGDDEDAPFASRVELELETRDLSRFSDLAGRPIGGGAALSLQGTVSPLEGSFDMQADGETNNLTLSLPELDGLIGGMAELSVGAARDETGFRVTGLSLDGAGITLRGDASFSGEDGSADLTAVFPDLSRIRPEMSGQGRVGAVVEIANGTAEAELDISGPGGARADLMASAPFDPEDGIGAIDASGRVAIDALSAFSGVAGRDLSGAVTVNGEGRFDPGTGAAMLDVTGTGNGLRVGMALADRVLAGSADLRLMVRRDASGTLDIQTARVSTPQLTASANGQVSDARADIDLDARLGNLAVIAPDFPGPLSVAGSISRGSAGAFQLDLDGTGPGGVNARVAGRIAEGFGRADLSINGSAPLALANGFIAPRLLRGTANFDLALNGPIGLNSLSGRVTSNGASLTLPIAGYTVQDMTIDTALSRGQARLDIGGTLSSGGQLRLTGPVTLSGGYTADLAVQLNQLILSDPGLYETAADGTITIDGPLRGGARIGGQINLGEVELRVPSGGGPELSGIELRHVNEPADVRASRSRAGLVSDNADGGGGGGAAYPLDIRVYAPSRIFVRGRGLDAELGGALRLRGTTANVITEGQFSLIRGRLDILGKRLLLTEALIRLQGDFDPFLRIVAESRTEDVLVQFTLQGPASEPDLTITSTPDLPQEDALSLFLFGSNPEELSAVQALRLAAAIRTLAGAGGEGILGDLREGLGVDDLDVAQDEDGTLGLRAGKYISENIYSDVTVDANGQSKVRLNLEITPNLTARGTAGTDGSSGLGLFFERDY